VARSSLYLSSGWFVPPIASIIWHLPTICADLSTQGWAARPLVHWSVPALSGVFLGIGIDLTFMALNNYLTDAYDTYSASALASSVFLRNIVTAVLLPLATYPLYEHLGTKWACSLLGLMCTTLTPIPFVFIRWGQEFRARSPFCQQLQRVRAETQARQADV
jgi:hypothetical protein